MNILIIGNSSRKFYEKIKESTMLDKFYVALNNSEIEVPRIDFNDKEDLVRKIKSLQIDVVLITDKDFISGGMVDYLKSKFVNVISPNQKWFNLEASRLIAKQLLNHYSINIPNIILAPKEFPLVFRTDLSNIDKIANNMDELVKLVEEHSREKTFLEEYLDGKCFENLCLWDGQTVCHFINKETLTEVQIERLELLQIKINFMLFEEQPDFMGFFSIKLIWAKNDWYVVDFSMSLDEKLILDCVHEDLLYILNSTIYQKNNELKNTI